MHCLLHQRKTDHVHHRSNRLSECALTLLYHLDDISKYLEKFTNIVNDMSILDRTFTDMEVLKPIYAALGLLGIHILKPYHYLMMDTDTNIWVPILGQGYPFGTNCLFVQDDLFSCCQSLISLKTSLCSKLIIWLQFLFICLIAQTFS